MAIRIDFRKLIHKAVHFLLNEGEKELDTAVRKAMDSEGVHPSQVTVEQLDTMKERTSATMDALSGK